MFGTLLTILGLCLFETISSVDNAVINAEVLGKMSERARRWFLLWGMLFAVLLLRGLLPWGIVILTTGLTPIEAFKATWSSEPQVIEAIEQSKHLLLIGAGTFLILLFLHWLFREEKKFGLIGEKFIYTHGLWFYACSSLFLTVIVWQSVSERPLMAFAATIGSTIFFITHGFKENAEEMERRMIRGESRSSDWAKIFYLEAIDAAFSIDGVVGAFAFTLSVPLILIGNGIGAIGVRYLTVQNIEQVKKLPFLKNGAMYSILFLGIVMTMESFGIHVPAWLSPIMTFFIIGWFLCKSVRHQKILNFETLH